MEQFPRILIADDYASFRDSLRRLLIRLGHQVEVAESAEKAVSLCAEKDFSLVLMDLEFRPGHQDGLEATRQLLAMNPSLPIIIVTATSRFRGHPHLVEEIQAMGIRGLLMKPVDLSSLDHAMTAIITGQDQEKPESLANPVTSVNLSSEVPHHLPLSQGDMGNWLRRELADLQRLTEAQACVLFHMSPTREVRVFANIGTPLTRYDESKYNLQATPIDEVIRYMIPIYLAIHANINISISSTSLPASVYLYDPLTGQNMVCSCFMRRRGISRKSILDWQPHPPRCSEQLSHGKKLNAFFNGHSH